MSGESDKPLVEVMIPTFNEADHIADAVATARHVGPVFVLDSLSVDGTQKVARGAGATVIEHPFVNYSAQKNWGLENLPFQTEWVLVMDADERVTPRLAEEIHRVLRRQPTSASFYVNRWLLFRGRLIRHGGMHPGPSIRLLRRGESRFNELPVHESLICKSRPGRLRHPLLHLRDKPFSDHLARLIRHADFESDYAIAEAASRFPGRGTAVGRALWRLVSMYLLRLGFLDGTAGWHVARLAAAYEYMFRLMYEDKLNRSASLSEQPPVR